MNSTILYSIKVIITTLLIAAFSIPVVKKIAIHINALDIPNERKVHKKPMPRLGGLGIFFAFLVGYMLFGQNTIRMNSILIGSFIIILTGMIDDIKPLDAKDKLIGQLLSAAIIAFYGEILLDNITAFGLNINFGYFAYPITIIFIVACMNIINLIDGLDGLAGGVSAIFFMTIIIICFFQGRTTGLEFTLALITLGSTLGFLVHNFYPAKIFAGDSGALFLGFIIAVISLLGFKATVLTSVFIPILTLGVPILDTFFAIIRRLLKHKKISDADKQHLHHQLLGMKFSHRNTVLIIYGVNILFATASIFYTLNEQIDIYIRRGIYLILLVLIFWFINKTNIITDKHIKFGKNK
ncbi:MAG: undecaprenyl/decaprenyl-phosphate alpha-N-acetylglucosaminyl 1-phosphate transferase [Erysipelotrichaceae bacterium]|nr:undecaprenyl/decaprenyl-phosphate alpha-N-acetylglucosaminyl 1-phosphate transferase [Erysipelotrichaceae bacterium]